MSRAMAMERGRRAIRARRKGEEEVQWRSEAGASRRLATSQSLAPLVCCCVIPHFVLAPSSICNEPRSGHLTSHT